LNTHQSRRLAEQTAGLPRVNVFERWRLVPFLYDFAFLIVVVIIGSGAVLSQTSAGEQTGLGLPVDCKLKVDCFVQQLPDVDPGPGTLDPLCGQATYQGHTGWDIRLRSLSDIALNVSVIALADGIVSRLRDGVPDQIFQAANDRSQLKDKECGNGIVIDHQGGLSSQYCHLKNGSLSVRTGAHVRKGERIGAIGSSGVAEFPHVHVSVRRDGKLVEPLTGQSLGHETPFCGDLSESLLDTLTRQALVQPTVAILDAGLAAAPPDLFNLVRSGGPPLATATTSSTVAWLWAINVDEGSRFRIRLVGPGEIALIDHTTNALPRRKANYLAYVGRKMGVKSGAYHLTAEIISGKTKVVSKVRSFTVSE
jgi:murein DD-endopeptidase MepM/ murein hydrolase activator NlpD